ncbi:MAG: hypothetical protein K2P93_04335 [Alphaproteobacteria bacterium]|nr:hypothetical protein [Alphaproteobacteria bacterium]
MDTIYPSTDDGRVVGKPVNSKNQVEYIRYNTAVGRESLFCALQVSQKNFIDSLSNHSNLYRYEGPSDVLLPGAWREFTLYLDPKQLHEWCPRANYFSEQNVRNLNAYTYTWGRVYKEAVNKYLKTFSPSLGNNRHASLELALSAYAVLPTNAPNDISIFVLGNDNSLLEVGSTHQQLPNASGLDLFRKIRLLYTNHQFQILLEEDAPLYLKMYYAAIEEKAKKYIETSSTNAEDLLLTKAEVTAVQKEYLETYATSDEERKLASEYNVFARFKMSLAHLFSLDNPLFSKVSEDIQKTCNEFSKLTNPSLEKISEIAQKLKVDVKIWAFNPMDMRLSLKGRGGAEHTTSDYLGGLDLLEDQADGYQILLDLSSKDKGDFIKSRHAFYSKGEAEEKKPSTLSKVDPSPLSAIDSNSPTLSVDPTPNTQNGAPATQAQEIQEVAEETPPPFTFNSTFVGAHVGIPSGYQFVIDPAQGGRKWGVRSIAKMGDGHVSVGGDGYVFYYQLPTAEMKLLHGKQFRLEVDVLSQTAGAYTQYWGYLNARSEKIKSAVHPGDGLWQTLRLDFTVDKNDTLHYIYPVILPAVSEGSEAPVVEVKNVRVKHP